MKYKLLILFIILSFQLKSQNLVQSGGFEGLKDNLNFVYGPFDFNDDHVWKLKRADYEYISTNYVSDQAQSGNKSVLMAVAGDFKRDVPWYGNVLYQKIPVKKNKKYKVTLWAKGNHSVMIHFFSLNPNTGEMYSSSNRESKPVSMKWNKYEFTLDTSFNTKTNNEKGTTDEMYSKYTFFCLSMTDVKTANRMNIPSYIWVDDVEVIEQ